MEILNRNIEDCDLVFLDLETTGLDAVMGDSICEIGALKVKDRKIIGEFNRLINPKKSIPQQAYAVHKISDEDLKDAPYFEEIVAEFIRFLQDSVVCAYNAGFDVGFIDQHLKKIDHAPLELPVIDILLMARDNLSLSRYNLKSTAESFNINCTGGFHRAGGDALIAYQIFLKLIDILRGKGIEKLEDFVSLYGLNNAVFKAKEKEKVSLVEQAINRGQTLSIEHFSVKRSVVENVVPLQVLKEGPEFYLLGQADTTNTLRIRLSRILTIKTPQPQQGNLPPIESA